MTGPSPRYFAVDDRPVEVKLASQTQRLALALDLASGALRRDDALLARIEAGGPGVEPLDGPRFRRLLQALRRVLSHDRQAMPMRWEPTGDPEYPYRAELAGVRYTVRLGDSPVEAKYSLEVDQQEVDSLDTWPKAWVKTDEAPKDLTHRTIDSPNLP
jgi:hypothetical protein